MFIVHEPESKDIKNALASVELSNLAENFYLNNPI